MDVRLLTRTHYQVDEPAYLRELVLSGAMPTRGEYSETVAMRLSRHLSALGVNLNVSAGKYCVDLARSLSLLTERNFWTDLGHVMNIIRYDGEERPFELGLSSAERIFFFRLFLEFDGAALLYFGELLARDGVIPPESWDWNDIANDMTQFIYTAYLAVLTDVRERSRLRQLLEKRGRQAYSGRSGAHQCFVHLQSLRRMGLIRHGPERRRYSAVTQGPSLLRLKALLGDVLGLERAISQGRWPTIAAEIFGADHIRARSLAEILEECKSLYLRVMATGATLCPIRTLCEAMQVRQIAVGEVPITRDDLMAALRRHQAGDPKAVRFHVDRIGRPAFILLS